MMLLMTNERCPIDNQIIYMRLLRKDLPSQELVIADGCYLDNDGVMVITMFDEDTTLPDYTCIHCGWTS